jgi:hypothetical protein
LQVGRALTWGAADARAPRQCQAGVACPAQQRRWRGSHRWWGASRPALAMAMTGPVTPGGLRRGRRLGSSLHQSPRLPNDELWNAPSSRPQGGMGAKGDREDDGLGAEGCTRKLSSPDAGAARSGELCAEPSSSSKTSSMRIIDLSCISRESGWAAAMPCGGRHVPLQRFREPGDSTPASGAVKWTTAVLGAACGDGQGPRSHGPYPASGGRQRWGKRRTVGTGSRGPVLATVGAGARQI